MIQPEIFSDFVSKLKRNDNKSWKVLSDVIKRPLLNWIFKNGIYDQVEVQIIFSDSLSTFAINIHNYTFENYENLRNCILTIALNKIREHRRASKKTELIDFNDLEKNTSLQYLKTSYNFSDENIQRIIKLLLTSCNEKEKQILIGYYYEEKRLIEIAEQLNITEENCRIIKYRVLNMLRNKIIELKNKGIIDIEI